METFVAVLHISVAFLLIILVLVQDSKGGSVGGAFGGGSNSVLGATGATTLAQKLTRWTAVLFAVTCVILTINSSRSHKSVVDSITPAEATAPAAPVSAPAAEVPATDTTKNPTGP